MASMGRVASSSGASSHCARRMLRKDDGNPAGECRTMRRSLLACRAQGDHRSFRRMPCEGCNLHSGTVPAMRVVQKAKRFVS